MKHPQHRHQTCRETHGLDPHELALTGRDTDVLAGRVRHLQHRETWLWMVLSVALAVYLLTL